MAPHKPKQESAQEARFGSGRVAKLKTPPKSDAQPRSYRLKRYKNGLLNLEKTPAHLIPVVQLNANSPLLRLPAEIRNNIWAYACGGNKVMLPARWNTTMKGGAVDLIRTADGTLTTFSFHSTTRKPAAFHLPEVCRQIYAETALISYKTNTFVCTEVVVSRRHPMARLMAAQRRAIKSLELFPYECACIVHGSDTALVSILRAWPNICRVIVTPEAMNWVRIWRNGQTTERADWNEEQWHAWVKDCLTRCKEGGFEVVFEG